MFHLADYLLSWVISMATTPLGWDCPWSTGVCLSRTRGLLSRNTTPHTDRCVWWRAGGSGGGGGWEWRWRRVGVVVEEGGSGSCGACVLTPH